MERLQKLMAHAGIASRRKAETIISDGRVTVNGKVATLGDKADPQKDDIRVDGKRLRLNEELRYVLLHKRRGIICTTDDPEGRTTVLDELGDNFSERLYPVGRLDIDSDGLVLLTNDGDLANRLTHPRYESEKTYKVLVEGAPNEKTLSRWRRGVRLDGEPTAPAVIKVLHSERRNTWLRIVMTEGKNRQIRRVAELLGHPVVRLTRTHIASIELGNLKPGQFRQLSKIEVNTLKKPKSSGVRRQQEQRKQDRY